MEYTRFELARVLGARALQLAMGAPPLVDPKDTVSTLSLAEQELKANKCPITVLKK